MDTLENEEMRAEGQGDESLNTGSAPQENSEQKHERKGGIHNNALFAASMGRSATAQVDPHSNRGLANTGTNISYEGPTSAGGGGSAGTGYTSGQSGAESSISSDSDYDQAAVGKHFKPGDSQENQQEQDENTDGNL